VLQYQTQATASQVAIDLVVDRVNDGRLARLYVGDDIRQRRRLLIEQLLEVAGRWHAGIMPPAGAIR
jgi:hypothetical protein